MFGEEERMKSVQWSATLIGQTREWVDRNAVGAGTMVAVKNVDGRFGICEISMSSGVHFDVHDRRSGQRHHYVSIESLIADGWAID
jgi:hypothetical protein